MNDWHPLDLGRLKTYPLCERKSLTRVEDILIPTDAPAPVLSDRLMETVKGAATAIRAARERGAAVMLIYGAHLLRNGAALLIDQLLESSWVTHLATNGAGTIHDWEYAWLGRSTESVEVGIAEGNFGTWDETGRWIQLALLAGGLRGEGYGEALGRFIAEDRLELPEMSELARAIAENPSDPLTAARADLLQIMERSAIPPGEHRLPHRWKQASILASAYRHGVPMSVHPGIGYDIITCHPMFSGAVVGRAGNIDFARFAGSLDQLDGGVVLSIGSAIMGPQVFEKAISCVNNIRLQDGRPLVGGHSLYVVDLQDGGNWDWTQGEPPKTNPAYYLRFCKSYSRTGGAMHYAQCDNAAFVHAIHSQLCPSR